MMLAIMRPTSGPKCGYLFRYCGSQEGIGNPDQMVPRVDDAIGLRRVAHADVFRPGIRCAPERVADIYGCILNYHRVVDPSPPRPIASASRRPGCVLEKQRNDQLFAVVVGRVPGAMTRQPTQIAP